MLLSSDTPCGITKSVGMGMIGFADIFTRTKPDIVVILGDRYEMFAVAAAAMIHRIPIAHIHGGELTEGVIDDPIRHSITKMSTLHFTATEKYRKRVIQLGEQPDSVFCVGALGVENIRSQRLMSRDELSQSINFSLDRPYIMVAFHPVILERKTVKEQFVTLLSVLEKFTEYQVIFTKANADTDGRIINQLIDKYVAENKDRVAAFVSLGMIRYLSAMQYCEMVIGNSSSGIIEAPSFHIPTVNIGSRQEGRMRGKTVIDCGCTMEEITEAVYKAQEMKRNATLKNAANPYEGAETSSRIVHVIKQRLTGGLGVKKQFNDVEWSD